MHVTIGINGSETNTSFGDLYQKPDSVAENYSYVHGVAGTLYNVDYYADNIKVYSSTGPTTPTIYEVVDSVEEWVEDGDRVNEMIVLGAIDDTQFMEKLGAFTKIISIFKEEAVSGRPQSTR